MAPRILILLATLFSLNAFAATELEPRELLPTGGNVSETASAFAAGKYLTVWRQQDMPYVGIWGAFSDANGKPLAPAFPVIANTNALNLRLFAAGDSFVLIWNEANRATEMCRVDGSGHVTMRRSIDPRPYLRADAFAGGRVMAVTTSGETHEAVLFDTDGDLRRSGIASSHFWSFETAFAGAQSFFIAERYPDLTVSRYSLDGERLQTVTIARDQCGTGSSPCWSVAGLQELSSGAILLLLGSGSQLATMTIAADGTFSVQRLVATTFAEIGGATIRRRGSELWLIAVGCPRPSGPYEVEARVIDENGAPAGDPVSLIQGLDVYETVVFAEGSDAVLAVTSPRTAQRQVQTFLFRELRPVEPQIVSITPTIQENTQIASNGGTYLAAWSDLDGVATPEVHWAVLDSGGQRHSAVFRAAGNMYRHALVTNGFDFVMLATDDGPLAAKRIAGDGTLLGETRLLDTAAPWPGGAAVVATSAGYLVVWSSGQAIYSSVLTPAGSASSPQEVVSIRDVPTGWTGLYTDLALAWDGHEVLMAVRRIELSSMFPVASTHVRLEAFRLRGDGSAVSTDPIAFPNDAAVATPSIIASSGDEFIIASYDQRFVIRRNAVVATFKTPGSAATDLIWDGNSYVLARGTSIIERLARDGSSLGATYRQGLQGTLDVAADWAGHLVMVASESDAAGPLRAFSYVASDFAPLQRVRRRAASR